MMAKALELRVDGIHLWLDIVKNDVLEWFNFGFFTASVDVVGEANYLKHSRFIGTMVKKLAGKVCVLCRFCLMYGDMN